MKVRTQGFTEIACIHSCGMLFKMEDYSIIKKGPPEKIRKGNWGNCVSFMPMQLQHSI